jgi:signal transduction histidine kinase
MHRRRRPHDDLPFSARSPLRVFGLVLLLVFAAEGAIMLALPRLFDAWKGTLPQSLVDAGALTLIMAPAVWFLAVLPLRRLFEARGDLLRRLLEAQEQERARIACDLHDSVGQSVTALMVGLRTIEDAGDLGTARSRARDLRGFAAGAHEEVRRLARGLRPLVLEELGLAVALERLCEDFQRTHAIGVALACDPATAGRLEARAETALYRIVQEALTNVARHAGARRVDVRLAQSGASITLTIRDDGEGLVDADAPGRTRRDHGFGMRSIRERALMLGGACSVQTRRGAGTTIEIRAPLEARP